MLSDRDANNSHSYILLDGLRGVAAISVAILHMPRVFGGFSVVQAHLAVDFFLQLSGFVIAFAYSGRIRAGMSLVEFLGKRINRLWPAYLVGFFLGLVVAALAVKFSGGGGLSVDWSLGSLFCSVGPNFLMVPQVGCGVNGLLFPINPPMWSVFDEIVANIIFFFIINILSNRYIHLSLIILMFITMVTLTYRTGLDIGFAWGSVLTGFIRIFFSFLTGVFILNLRQKYRRDSDLVTLLMFTILAAILLANVNSYLFEIVAVTIAFPLVMSISVRFNPRRELIRWLCIQLGKASYVLYVIHKPLYQLCYGATLKFVPEIIHPLGAMLGVIWLVIFVAIAWAVAVLFEPFARTMLGSRPVVFRRI